jgi:hypothetical protein
MNFVLVGPNIENLENLENLVSCHSRRIIYCCKVKYFWKLGKDIGRNLVTSEGWS